VQYYLESKFGLQPLFLYHPFYPYPVVKGDNDTRSSAISISRIAFEKNIEIILKANKLLKEDEVIKIYGARRRRHYILQRQNLDFYRHYYGQFEKSFSKLSEILSKAKFVVDLSVLKHDGGGTQYTFLEAIHNGCAIIVNRKWLEQVDPKYSDFREGHNCFAVSDEKELAELIKSDPDKKNC
jgi:glycosyltransferase involved in cell wall biosynthesis